MAKFVMASAAAADQSSAKEPGPPASPTAVLTSSPVMDRVQLPSWGELDISLKITLGLATFTAAASAITLPNQKEKERAALDLFDKPWERLNHQDQMAAEFSAGYKRWTGFFEHKV